MESKQKEFPTAQEVQSISNKGQHDISIKLTDKYHPVRREAFNMKMNFRGKTVINITVYPTSDTGRYLTAKANAAEESAPSSELRWQCCCKTHLYEFIFRKVKCKQSSAYKSYRTEI